MGFKTKFYVLVFLLLSSSNLRADTYAQNEWHRIYYELLNGEHIFSPGWINVWIMRDEIHQSARLATETAIIPPAADISGWMNDNGVFSVSVEMSGNAPEPVPGFLDSILAIITPHLNTYAQARKQLVLDLCWGVRTFTDLNTEEKRMVNAMGTLSFIDILYTQSDSTLQAMLTDSRLSANKKLLVEDEIMSRPF